MTKGLDYSCNVSGISIRAFLSDLAGRFTWSNETQKIIVERALQIATHSPDIALSDPQKELLCIIHQIALEELGLSEVARPEQGKAGPQTPGELVDPR